MRVLSQLGRYTTLEQFFVTFFTFDISLRLLCKWAGVMLFTNSLRSRLRTSLSPVQYMVHGRGYSGMGSC